MFGKKSGQGRDRTADTGFFRPVLFQLSYLAGATDRIARAGRVDGGARAAVELGTGLLESIGCNTMGQGIGSSVRSTRSAWIQE